MVVLVMVLGVVDSSVSPRQAAADESTDQSVALADMRARWLAVLTGGSEADLSNPEVAARAQVTGDAGQTRWDSLNTGADRTYLWPDQQPSTTNSNWVNGSYNNVRAMALAFATEGSGLEGDPELRDAIVDALEWLHANAANGTVVSYGNWWNFEIGIQIRMGDILTLMHDELTQDQATRFVAALDHFKRDIDPATTGANRADQVMSKLLQMVALGDSDRIAYYRDEAAELFEYVTVGDGMYRDGSFVQHTDVASTGSYGEVLLRGVANIVHLLDGSAWTLPEDNLGVVSEWVFNAYEPVIYKGRYMDMVRGRSITTDQSERAAAATMGSILRISQALDGADGMRMQAMVKHWAEANPSYDYIAQFPIDVIPFATRLFADPAIDALGDLPMHREMGNMGRSVHKANDWAFGVSMSSVRTQNYELTNGANGKGWYTGDGMTYLHTRDLAQFAGAFWPTVDWHRLPGTTVDTLPRKFDHYQYGDGEGQPKNVWAGGVTLGDYGASGMNLRPLVTGLEANKSWFMFDDEVVALGTAIQSNSGRDVETIVEQRKLNADGSNVLTVNGNQSVQARGSSETLDAVEWAHLEGDVPGSGIGYYFPEPTRIEALRAEQTGSWYDINQNPGISQEVLRADYLTMRLEHGPNPSGAGYGYVLLPNTEAGDVAGYATAPDVEVLENSATVHAVRENGLQLTAANFFADSPATAADLISVNRSASVIVEEGEGEQLRVAVSDPTFQNTGAILVEVNRSAASMETSDPQVSVLQLHPTIKLLVDVGDSAGATFAATFDTDPDRPRDASTFEFPQPGGDPVGSDAGLLSHASDDFEAGVLFNRPEGWDADDDSGTKSLVVENEVSGNRLAYLYDDNVEGSASLTKRFDQQNEYVDVQFSWAEPLGASGANVRVVGQGATALELVSRNGGLYARVGDGYEPLITEVGRSRWYRIELAVIVNQGTADVVIDGQLVQQGLPLSGPGVVDAVTFQSGVASTRPLLVDDLVIPIHGGVSVLRDTFDQVGIGTQPQDWAIKQRLGSAPVSVVEDPSGFGRSLLLDDNDPKFTAEALRTFERQTGRFTFEWRFREPTSGKWSAFTLGEGATPGVRIQANGVLLKLTNPDGVVEDVATLGVDTWHAVRLEIDTTAGLFDLYLNGEPVRSGVPLLTDVVGIDSFKVTTSYGAVDAPLLIDDVFLYRVAPVVAGVEDGAQYSSPVVPVFRVGVGQLAMDGAEPVAFASGTTVSRAGEYVLEVAHPNGAVASVGFRIVEPPEPVWDAAATYVAGDRVSHHGATHVAQWWTRDQAPGSVTGPWMERGELVSAAGGGVRVWTQSWVYSAGDRVAHDGRLWEAKWWTRNQQPGDAYGPWADLGAY